jgi:hypothetical protein
LCSFLFCAQVWGMGWLPRHPPPPRNVASENGAPEIDAAGATGGLAVLAGVLALIAERKRRKKS